MNEYWLMEKYTEDNVDEIMFKDDSKWDTEHEYIYDGTHFIRKCKSFIGINWCYCKSKDMPLPWPCLVLIKKKSKNNKLKSK